MIKTNTIAFFGHKRDKEVQSSLRDQNRFENFCFDELQPFETNLVFKLLSGDFWILVKFCASILEFWILPGKKAIVIIIFWNDLGKHLANHIH